MSCHRRLSALDVISRTHDFKAVSAHSSKLDNMPSDLWPYSPYAAILSPLTRGVTHTAHLPRACSVAVIHENPPSPGIFIYPICYLYVRLYATAGDNVSPHNNTTSKFGEETEETLTQLIKLGCMDSLYMYIDCKMPHPLFTSVSIGYTNRPAIFLVAHTVTRKGLKVRGLLK